MECSDGVNELLVKLPQAQSATDTFSLFAGTLHQLFCGLQHISLLLLPAESPITTPCGQQLQGAAATGAQGRSVGGKHAAKGTGGGISNQSCSTGGKGSTGQTAGAATTDFACKLQAFRAGYGLDWSNCCVFNLYAGRGPVVQAPPLWPVTCTATCYAAVTVQDVVTTGNYTADGPHFLDWKALAEQGNNSMAAVPLYSCNKPVAVLCLASKEADAFGAVSTLKLLGGLLAPCCSLLTYSTRLTEMRRLVNEIIAPIAAQLAQQKHDQLAKLGCTVEEAPPGSVPADGKGISVAVGGQVHNHSSSSSSSTVMQPVPVVSIGSASAVKQRRGCSKTTAMEAVDAVKASAQCGTDAQCKGNSKLSSSQAGTALSHKRFESVIVKGSAYEPSGFGCTPDCDLDWSDFFFNLVSMAIVYVYFSKTAAAGESLVAIILCMGVAGLDILFMAMRWLWFDHYIAYGNMVMTCLQAYRVIVLPIANTWMSWSLLHKMSITPSGPLIVLLGIVLLACIIMGLQVRFFLHAPLQLASVLFAAMSTPEICGAFFDSTSSIKCVGIISALQLSLGLLLPSVCMYFLEGRSGRVFLPHMQAKRWLVNS